MRRAFDDATTPDSTTAYGFVLDHVLVKGGLLTEEEVLAAPPFPQDHRPLRASVSPALTAPIVPSAGLSGALAP